MKPDGRAWVADPTLAWVIALHVTLRQPIDPAQVSAGLAASGLHGSLLGSGVGHSLLELVTAPGPTPLRAAVSGRELALGAHHEHCDGLGLLALLRETTGIVATSSARGLADRPQRGSTLSTALRRAGEAVLAPPATVAAPPAGTSSPEGAGDAFFRFSVPRRLPVSELAHAAVLAVVDHNRALSARHDRIAVAIGASRVGGAIPSVRDQSALLRLRRVEQLSEPALRDAIRTALPEPPPPGTGRRGGPAARMTTAAMGLLSQRLGSTLLVSHLGEVDAPGIEDMAFYPVTGGGSGVSVGAVGRNGTTVVTLRGRRHRHSVETLAALGSRVRDELSSAGS